MVTMADKRIVVGVDGSPSSMKALRWAIRQAKLTGAEVEAVTAWSYCGCREPRPRHATRRYSLIMPLTRACLLDTVLLKIDRFG